MFGKNLIAALILAGAAFFLVAALDSELLAGLAAFLALAGGGAALATIIQKQTELEEKLDALARRLEDFGGAPKP